MEEKLNAIKAVLDVLIDSHRSASIEEFETFQVLIGELDEAFKDSQKTVD